MFWGGDGVLKSRCPNKDNWHRRNSSFRSNTVKWVSEARGALVFSRLIGYWVVVRARSAADKVLLLLC